MSVIKVSKENFESEVLNSDKPVLVDFNANWCGPCKMLKPILDEVSEERTDVKIVSVNIDDEDELAEDYSVYSIPCLVLFKNGAEAKRSVGLIPKTEVENFINQ
ncbi:MAG: thioredoxin [Clostridia bacterium]|nr:thioredoxin [Clostridia bacterium]